ncbi:MAG: beta-galactosidase [Chthoniobacterales bacterium]|nr:beta-galactosidase [Chthoniobacterales bacterium]
MKRKFLQMPRKASAGFSTFLAGVISITAGVALAASAEGASPAGNVAAITTKPVSFEMLDDYNKGQDLNEVALDFQLMNELGIDTMRCSFGWDDYEPTRGVYDFTWLKQFVALANQYGIKLRPYIGYTAPWAGRRGTDGVYWNDPPEALPEWYNFVYHLAAALRPYPNVLSYEIYNEENDSFWWEGSRFTYRKTLAQAALAIRAANPDAQVILGGMVFPDFDWLSALVDYGLAKSYDITPFHAYPETFEDPTVEQYLDVQYHDYFVPLNNKAGGHKPIWINEMGYATTAGITKHQQADWYVRAVSTFLADPNIQGLGFFEIRDVPITDPVLGQDAEYHLGLVRSDRTKKLAFSTVQMLMGLLNHGKLTIADQQAQVSVISGQAGELYSHLFKRPDGTQILFVYDKTSTPTVSVALEIAGSKAYKYNYDGSFAAYPAFDGTTLPAITLTPGTAAIFRIDR